MKTNYLIQDLIKNSSQEMQKLFSEEFGMYSFAKDKKSPEPAPESPAPEIQEGLTYGEWKKYLKNLDMSGAKAAKEARASRLNAKIKRAEEYLQKISNIKRQFNKIANKLHQQLSKSKGPGINDDTIIPNSLIISSTGDTGAGREQRRGGGRGGKGNLEGVDLDASSRDRDFSLVPFGPFMNLAKINQADLLSENYEDVREAFGDFIDIRNFRSARSIMDYTLKPDDRYTDYGRYLNSLLKAINEISTNWQSSVSEEDLPDSYLRQQNSQLENWRGAINGALRMLYKKSDELKEEARRLRGYEEREAVGPLDLRH